MSAIPLEVEHVDEPAEGVPLNQLPQVSGFVGRKLHIHALTITHTHTHTHTQKQKQKVKSLAAA